MTTIPPTIVREIADTDDEDELCGAELSAGGTCERPASECPYHG